MNKIKMKGLSFLCLAFLSTLAIVAQPIQKFTKIDELGGIEEYLYEPNGLKVLLMQDNSTPVVTVQIVYHVGSKNEVPGNTGATHLLEHLMFKGTPTYNRKNGNAIFDVLQNIGAKMNATTWYDRTNYFETIPSDHIETAIKIEADRMRNSLLLKEDKEAEMTVVRNEFERGENNPGRVLNKEIWATAYQAHPYHHSTIGWRSDIENMPIEVLREFYNTYYWPNNATLTIIGDFEKQQTFRLIDQYFGVIPKAPHEIPQPYTEEPEQTGKRLVTVKKQSQRALIAKGYKIPGRLHEDLPALVVLGELMGSGPASTLNQVFVDKGKALYAYSGPSMFKEVGLYSINLGLLPAAGHEAIDQELLAVIDSIKEVGYAQSEIDRVIKKLNAQTILSRDGSGAIASELNEAIAGGDWKDFVRGAEKLNAVTAEDVRMVANKYLVEDQSTTGYFIPKTPGGDVQANAGSSNWKGQEGKYYYRHPDLEVNDPSGEIDDSKIEQTPGPSEKSITTKEKYVRKQVAGIDVVSWKTGAKSFVTVSASISIKGYFSDQANIMVPDLTAAMLSNGTKMNDKVAFAKKLEVMGVNLYFGASDNFFNINFKCLKQDLPRVTKLLAEALRYPLFDETEFSTLVERTRGGLMSQKDDPGKNASIALTQVLFPEDHPNYSSSVDARIRDLEEVTIQDLKAFHKKYIGPESFQMVVVGDVDEKTLYASLKKSFNGWTGGQSGKLQFGEVSKVDSQTKVITIPEKTSATLLIGQYTGLDHADQDYYPFLLGNSILGRGFSGRLMKTVRDGMGLTYGIGSSHSGDIYSGGYWSVSATFNPALFEKGLNATMEQLELWVDKGVTEEELTNMKSNISGTFKVGMATTSGLSNTILSFIQRGLEPDYIDKYPQLIQAVTLEGVNSAIKKYIDLDKLVIIKSGSLDQDGLPLN